MLVVEVDEGKAAGLLSEAVPGDVHIADRPILLEDAPQGAVRDAVGQVVHLEGDQVAHVGRRTTVIHDLCELGRVCLGFVQPEDCASLRQLTSAGGCLLTPEC